MLTNIYHPDIAVGLSQYVDRIARGELPEHATTLKMLIEKLTFAALAAAQLPQPQGMQFAAFMPNGPSACPNTKIHTQYLCSICGMFIT